VIAVHELGLCEAIVGAVEKRAGERERVRRDPAAMLDYLLPTG
jgi:hypothetical protein